MERDAIKKGDRIVISGRSDVARVADIVPIPSEARTAYVVDWGVHGMSRVYDHDEGKVWVRYADLN